MLVGWARVTGCVDGVVGSDGEGLVPFPSLGGVAGAKRLTGWLVTFLHTLERTTPALRATPPKEGNFSAKGRREAPTISFPSLGGEFSAALVAQWVAGGRQWRWRRPRRFDHYVDGSLQGVGGRLKARLVRQNLHRWRLLQQGVALTHQVLAR